MRIAPKSTGGFLENLASLKAGNFLIVLLLAGGFAFLSHVASSFLGPVGLVALAGGTLAALLAAALALRSPVLVFVLWMIFLSGLETVGMIRMPGLPDVSIVRLVMILIMVIMLVGWLFGRPLFRAPFLPDILLLLHTGYILYNAMFIADGTHFNLWYVSSLAPMVGYFFGKQFFEDERQIGLIVYTFLFMTAYFWFVSIAEHFRIEALIWPKAIIHDMKTRWIGRSRGPFLQPGVFGQILGIYLLFHFFLLVRNFNRFRKILVSLNLALGSVGLLFTYTRGTWISTIAGLLVLVALRSNYRKIILSVGLVVILAGTAGLLQQTNDQVLQERVGNTGTIENRAGVMYANYQALKQNPFFGIGFFMFKKKAHLYSQGVDVPGIGYVKKKMGDHGSIHDQYVGRAAEEGLIGMALWFAFVFAVVWQYRVRWREDPQGEWFNRDMIAIFAAASAAYLVGGLTYNLRFFGLINILPYFFAGVAAGFPGKRLRISDGPNSTGSENP